MPNIRYLDKDIVCGPGEDDTGTASRDRLERKPKERMIKREADLRVGTRARIA
jgi:hypothetical protein